MLSSKLFSFTFYGFIESRCKGFFKYFALIHFGSRDNSTFEMEILLIFYFLPDLSLWNVWLPFTNVSHNPKSQTMLLRFLYLFKVKFLMMQLVATLDWIRLNKENGKSKTFFLNQFFCFSAPLTVGGVSFCQVNFWLFVTEEYFFKVFTCITSNSFQKILYFVS